MFYNTDFGKCLNVHFYNNKRRIKYNYCFIPNINYNWLQNKSV